MTDAVQRGAFTAQPTCCLPQRPRITGLRLCSLEISHRMSIEAEAVSASGPARHQRLGCRFPGDAPSFENWGE
jgi:hypothetical protein